MAHSIDLSSLMLHSFSCRRLCVFGNDDRCTPAARLLGTMLCVNIVLTIAQLWSGIIANSLALIGDGSLMAIDAVSYGVNLYVERQKAAAGPNEEVAGDRSRIDRFGAGASAVMLAATNCWLLFIAADRLLADPEELGAVPEVNGSIIIAFTAVNLAADVGLGMVVWRCGAAALLAGQEKSKSSNASASDDVDSDDMNLCSALAHLAADAVRGFAVLACGIFAVTGVVDATRADAVTSLFVCVFVLAAACSLLRVLIRRTVPTAYEEFDADAPEGMPPSQVGLPQRKRDGDVLPEANGSLSSCSSPTASAVDRDSR